MGRVSVHSKEFRDEAVRLSYTSGKTVASVAKELGIKPEQLHVWRRQARHAHAVPVASDETLEQQIKRLARENELLREEAAILKKAIAYFAQPPKK